MSFGLPPPANGWRGNSGGKSKGPPSSPSSPNLSPGPNPYDVVWCVDLTWCVILAVSVFFLALLAML
jgi:hypothetical protein